MHLCNPGTVQSATNYLPVCSLSRPHYTSAHSINHCQGIAMMTMIVDVDDDDDGDGDGNDDDNGRGYS